MESSLRFGEKDEHTFTVRFSQLTGKEVYLLDGEEIRRARNWRLCFSEHFEIGDIEKHNLEIRVSTYPWKAEVFLNRQRIVDGLFPDLADKNLHAEFWMKLSPLAAPLALCVFFALGAHRDISIGTLLSSIGFGFSFLILCLLHWRYLLYSGWSILGLAVLVLSMKALGQYYHFGLLAISFFSFLFVLQAPIRRILRR